MVKFSTDSSCEITDATRSVSVAPTDYFNALLTKVFTKIFDRFVLFCGKYGLIPYTAVPNLFRNTIAKLPK